MNRAGARFCGLFVLWLGVELLERIAYRAGVDDAGQVADNTLAALTPKPGDWWADEDELRQWAGAPPADDLADAVDIGDVLAEHIACECCT